MTFDARREGNTDCSAEAGPEEHDLIRLGQFLTSGASSAPDDIDELCQRKHGCPSGCDYSNLQNSQPNCYSRISMRCSRR